MTKKIKKSSKTAKTPYLPSRKLLENPRYRIFIRGKKLSDDMLSYVSSIEVTREEENLPQAVITVNDLNKKWLKGTGIGKGSSVRIDMGYSRKMQTEFRGKISFVDVDYQDSGNIELTLTCIVRASNLAEKEISKTYKNKTISQILAHIHRIKKIPFRTQKTKKKYKKVTQSKETYLDFITKWKEKIGWEYYELEDGTMYFGEAPDGKARRELRYRKDGLEIISFKPTFEEVDVEKEDEKTISNKGKKQKSSSKKKKKKKTTTTKGKRKIAGRA